MNDDRLDRAGLLQQKLAGYRERGVSRVKPGLTDLDGGIRGKYVNLGKFTALMERGGGFCGFCGCVFGWDSNDALYDGGRHTGWQHGFPDARYRLPGGEFVDHPAMSRHWESREYERHVNGWQLERYFEII